jgi:penicillin-binding protein 2
MKNKETISHLFQTWRVAILYVLLVIVFGFYTYRLFNIQILRGNDYLVQADKNRTKEINIPTQRGTIYDRNDFILARNIASYNIVITPALLPGDVGTVDIQTGAVTEITGTIQEIYRQLGQLISMPVSKGQVDEATVKIFKPCDNDLGIIQIVAIADTNYPWQPTRIKCNIDAETARIVSEKAADWPGVAVEVEPVRDYPTGDLTAEVIGFLGPIPAGSEQLYTDQGFLSGRDKIGYAGVEDTLQEILQGKNGLRQVEVDVAGRELRDLAATIDPISGNSVRLTIDTRLQLAAKTALINQINFLNTYAGKIKTTSGVVIAMNPKTGEILAMVSYPSYENNRMAREIPAYYYEQLSLDLSKPLLNHAISGEFPPGSVYKLATAIGALNEGVVTPDQKLNDPGLITITEKYYANDPGNPRNYVCYLRTGHGEMDFLHGLAQSCDVYFYKIGGGYQDEVPNGGLGPWRMAEYAKILGYGTASGIELRGEATGLVPDPKWKRLTVAENWATGDTYISTIGQGYVLATPLQVLESLAAVANNGVLMKPTLVREVLSPSGEVIQPFKPVIVRDIIKESLVAVYNDQDIPTGEKRSVQPWVMQLVKQGLHMVITEGTAMKIFAGDTVLETITAGKTGTAEYCDNIAQALNLCQPEAWPTHR